MANKILHGVIVYTILNNDCLTGFWTNNDHRKILTENARKFSGQKDDITGNYVCCYIDHDGSVFSGQLTISPQSVDRTYEFRWDIISGNNSFGFDGIGFMIEDSQIAVSYISVDRHGVGLSKNLGIL